MDMLFDLIGFILKSVEYLGVLHLVGGLVLAIGLSQDYSRSESLKYLLGFGLLLIVGGLVFGNQLHGGLSEAVRLRGSAGQTVGLGVGFFSGTIIGLCLRSLLKRFRKGDDGKN